MHKAVCIGPFHVTVKPSQGFPPLGGRHISIHSGLHSRVHILVKGVGCHGDDRHIGNGRVVQRADGPGGRIAVHHQHHDIHEHQIDETRLALRHIVRSQLAVLLPRIFKNIAKRLVNPHKKWYTFSVSRFLPAGFILSPSSRRAWIEIREGIFHDHPKPESLDRRPVRAGGT